MIIGFSSINSSISARPPPPPKERSEMERVTFWTFGLSNYTFNIYIKYNTYYISIYYSDPCTKLYHWLQPVVALTLVGA